MSKLEIEFELTGLKLKIKGDSDEVSGKVADLQRQVQGMMATISAMAQEGVAALPPAPDNGASAKLLESAPMAPEQNGSRASRKSPARKASGVGSRQRAEAIDFKHDADKYGFPKQNWTTAQKAMWMIYVLGEQGDEKEFSASVIAATFNKHFKSFGTILAQNVLRDLGKEKGKSGAVNSDASQDPMKWYLLEAGKKQIPSLVEEAREQPTE
jgi:hypothetical protein